MMLGVPVDAPDDVAPVAVAVARRTLELVAGGYGPAAAYEQALVELVPDWASRR